MSILQNCPSPIVQGLIVENQRREKPTLETVYGTDDIEKMKNYEIRLNKSIEEKIDGDVVMNLGENYASLLMSKLLELTKNTLCMVVGSFDGRISNKENYVYAFEQCIKRGVTIQVIFVDEKPNRESIACKLIKKYVSEGKKIITRQAKAKAIQLIKDSFNNNGEIVHFAIFDDDKYRVETIPSTYTAFGSFRDKEYVKNLNDIFYNLTFQSELITI